MPAIGSLAVNIIARTDQFISGINNAQKQLRKFVDMSGVLRAAIVGRIGQAMNSAVEATSQLVDMSQATGIAVEQLDFLRYAAEQTGTDITKITTAFRELISKGISPAKIDQIAAELGKIADPTARARKALDIFGKRAGLALLPMLRDLPALKKRFLELGGGVTAGLANRMDQLGDAMADVRFAMRNATIMVVDALRPALMSLANSIIAVASLVKSWSAEYPGLVGWIVKAIVVVGVLTPAIWSLNQALTAIKYTLIAIKTVAASGIVAKLLAAVVANPAILIPLAAVAAVGGAAYGVSKLTGGGQPAPLPTAPTPDDATGQEQVRQQEETNNILRQMVRGGGGGSYGTLQVAGVY